MAIVEVIIDDRLIHGQVCGYWVPHHSVEKIVVIDDKIAKDEMRKTALKFGCPAKVKLSILDALTASDKLKRNLDKGSRVMLLAAGPEPLLKMVEDGYAIKQITDADIDNFKRLADHGVKLLVQMVPDDVPEDLAEIVRKL